MIVHRRRLCAGEDGVSLILALVFLALFGAAVPALLNLVSVNSQMSTATRDVDQALYAADGGAEMAIQALRLDNSLCPRPAAGVQSLPSRTLNGWSVQVTCQATAGDAAVPTSRTVLLTATAHTVTIKAVVVFGSDAATPPAVQSWRKT